MIQIDRQELDILLQYEKELNALFEKLVYVFVKDWCNKNKKLRFEWNEKKDVVSDYVNQKIVENKISFNGSTPHVWFNSQGAGSMLYWATKDSKSIPGIDSLIRKAGNL